MDFQSYVVDADLFDSSVAVMRYWPSASGKITSTVNCPIRRLCVQFLLPVTPLH
jgi:hypothetical protein